VKQSIYASGMAETFEVEEIGGDAPRARAVSLNDHERNVKELETDFDHYATSKSVSQNMLNISTIQGLIVTMVNMFNVYGNNLGGLQIGLVILIVLSIILQFIIFVLLVILSKAKKTNTKKITSMNSAVTSLSGLLLIITSGISVLAIDGAPPPPSQSNAASLNLTQ